MPLIVKLPPELQDDPTYLKLVQEGVTEWSQLVAWTWSSHLAFEHQPEAAQELELKQFLMQSLKAQAIASFPSRYGISNEIDRANRESLVIKKLLIGDNDKIPSWPNPTKLTIPDVYITLVGRPPEALSNPNFMNMFHVQVITDQFYGNIREITQDEKQSILDTFANDPDDLPYVEPVKFVNNMAYPPRPALGPDTVTEEELVQWMTNREGYLPPSPYIPVSAT